MRIGKPKRIIRQEPDLIPVEKPERRELIPWPFPKPALVPVPTKGPEK